MIRGIGTDIENVARFRDPVPGLLDRILSPEDKDYIGKFSDPATRIAGIWAAKEALVKALGRADAVVFNRVSVLHGAEGRPYFSYRPDEGTLHLSVAHSDDQAVAVVVWEA